MFKKLKEKIEFLKWAYKNRDLNDPYRQQMFIKYQQIMPEKIIVRKSCRRIDYDRMPGVCEGMLDTEIAKTIACRCKSFVADGPYEDIIWLEKTFWFAPVNEESPWRNLQC